MGLELLQHILRRVSNEFFWLCTIDAANLGLLSIAQCYKIVIWFIWKIIPYSSCRFRSYYKGENDCYMRGSKWKFNVFVTMGQVFHLAPFVCRWFFCAATTTTYLPITIEANSTKTLFPCFDIARTVFFSASRSQSRTWVVFGDYMFHVLESREMFQ